jgi:two-component system response regulator PilR (NtrC family)
VTPAPTEAITERGTGRRRVLVIDDEPDICDCLRLLLSLEGFDVITAESGLVAIDKAKTESFDIAITDLRMPGMGGIETLTALKRLKPDIRVIVATAFASDESARRCREEGADEYLTKPYSLEDVMKALKGTLARSPAPSHPCENT